MILIIRFVFIILFFGCIIGIPLFLFKLNQLEKTKKQQKEKEERIQKMKQTQEMSAIKTPSFSYQTATPKVKLLFSSIEEKLNTLKAEGKWLSVESNHYLTETFPKDFENYAKLYENIKDKQSVEEEVVQALQFMINELKKYEAEVEEKKKTALQRQEYIIETREKHL